MAEYSISSANLKTIERGLKTIDENLGALNNNIEVIDQHVDSVNSNVKVVYDEIGSLTQEFREFMQLQTRANALSKAQQRVIQIRQELDKKYGHYDIVRRTTTGILQANDIGIVKKDTISTATEELMLSTPGYWLAPCLVALSAWINDQPELADRALKEAIKRNDEKTSLFFALICRRANRKLIALRWTQRYLEKQDEENLDRKTIIILDAYASGLLGADSENIISKQMEKWMEHLTEKPGFVEQQKQQWSDAINLKRKPFSSDEYTYLSKYSKTWPVLQDIMEGALLHAEILSYFTSIFDKEVSTDALKAQLDDILNNLVSEFDDEELPLRKEEKYNQFIIDFNGDEKRARQNMSIEQSAFEIHKDFTQLLTDAAMKPESSNASASTQKFAIALSKEWISAAYNDLVAENRMKIPVDIEINVDSFNAKTADGQNENELIYQYNSLIDNEKCNALSQIVLSGFEQFCLYGGACIGFLGLLLMVGGSAFLGLIGVISGIGMVINHFSKKDKIEETRKNIENGYEEKRSKGTQIIRATLAEVVDFRAEYAEKESESQNVVNFLEQINPEQYVRKLSGSNRTIKLR